MTPIERLTPEELAERYPRLHPKQRRFFARGDAMRAAYEQWVTDGRPGNKLPPSLKQLFAPPGPLVVSPRLYNELEHEMRAHGRAAKRRLFENAERELAERKGWPDGTHGVQPDGRWNFIHQHVGNRHERRAAAARKRRAK